MYVKTRAAVLPCFGEAAGVVSNGAGTSEQSLSWEKTSRLGQWESARGNLVLFTGGTLNLCISKGAIS